MPTNPIIWQVELAEKSCHSTARYALDYAAGEGNFVSMLSKRHWAVKAVETDEEKRRQAQRRYALKPIGIEELKVLEEMSFSMATWWNCPQESGAIADTLKLLKRIIVESGTVIVSAAQQEVSQEEMAAAAASAGLGIEETIPYPTQGFLSSLKQCYYKKHLTEAPRLVYLLRRKEILDFRVLYK